MKKLIVIIAMLLVIVGHALKTQETTRTVTNSPCFTNTDKWYTR